MAITKDSLKSLLKSLHYSDEEITDYVDSADEKEISLKPDVRVYDNASLDALKENVKKSAKQTYINAGMEIAIKNLKEKTGLDFEGKDEEEFISHFTQKVQTEANIKPAELSKKHEQEKKEWQQQLLQAKEQAAAIQREKEAIETERTYLSAFPKGDKVLSDSDLLQLAKLKVQAVKDGENTIYTYNGKELKDDLHNPLPLSAAMEHVFKSENWIKEAAEQGTGAKGLGFKDSGKRPNTFNNPQELASHMESKGINPLTKEGREFIYEATKANPELGKRA
jgi:hypothetical protein